MSNVSWVILELLIQVGYFCTLSLPSKSRANLDKIKFATQSDKENFLTTHPEMQARYSSADLDASLAVSQTYSYCFKCQVVKPERAHHCSTCNKCYLKMDHHCPWVGNCVGFRNHKFFVGFLFFGTLTTGVMMGTLILPLIGTFGNSDLSAIVLLSHITYALETYNRNHGGLSLFLQPLFCRLNHAWIHYRTNLE